MEDIYTFIVLEPHYCRSDGGIVVLVQAILITRQEYMVIYGVRFTIFLKPSSEKYWSNILS